MRPLKTQREEETCGLENLRDSARHSNAPIKMLQNEKKESSVGIRNQCVFALIQFLEQKRMGSAGSRKQDGGILKRIQGERSEIFSGLKSRRRNGN